jgi:uncharacterized membrane protein YhaH (DUF805 family)
MTSMASLLDLFSLSGRVSRTRYLATGVLLMFLKFLGDAVGFWLLAHERLVLLDYLNPFSRWEGWDPDDAPTLLYALVIAWALPFMWIGVCMSARRASDAGISLWWALGFMVPVFNFLVIGSLACLPSRGRDSEISQTETYTFRTASVGVAVTALLIFASVALIAQGVESYGYALFFTTPFFLGAVIGFLLRVPRDYGFRVTVGVVSVTLFVGCLALLFFALEGIICIMMAMPIALPAAALGALFGRALGSRSGDGVRPDATLGAMVLLLPLGAGIEKQVSVPRPREVVSMIEVDATPEEVWENVVSFSELPEPDHWLFETGIAYPLRARIEGEGVGAVRYCEFSTGAFVEPITRWEKPTRLSFDVEEQPIPMEEWSFYAEVHPPHLEQSFRSVRGEFRLIELPSGRTRLEGSTWYVLDMGPAPYWKLWSDEIVHRIHQRVLAHIKYLSER